MTSVDVVEELVKSSIAAVETKLVQMRYRFNVEQIISSVIKQEPTADAALVKKEVELQVLLKLGPKTAQELASNVQPIASKSKPAKENVPAAKKSKPTESTANSKSHAGDAGADDGAETIDELMRSKVKFHPVGGNASTDGYVTTEHTDRLIKQHVLMRGGRVQTRFPPEPNGLLHIGHAKAINIDFGYALAQGGECNLRYDDTNPEKEEERFFVGIRDMIEWLGYKPTRITHTSDNFDQLFKWAVQLIREGHAYVCHQRADEMKGFNPPPSPYRERPIEESEQLFYNMRDGRFAEGEATLRMKLTLEDSKQDPVIYRIKYVHHHRSGDKWCIYPTYDYAHGLCDSIENVTHSLCTKEFQAKRSSYYWLCNTLRVYCPVQWEFGRLGMTYTIMSKRKIQELINDGIVADYDDPRLFTLTALRRRGVPAAAINTFVAKLGVTTAQTIVEPHLLDACIRDELNATAKRCMAVMNPLRVNITNFKEAGLPTVIERPDYPSDPSRGSHKVPFSSVVYIDGDDFRATSVKGFKRFTPEQSVGLMNANVVLTVTHLTTNSAGEPTSIDATAEVLTPTNKPKGFIQWVCDGLPCEVRLYGQLFKHANPEDTSVVPGGFKTDINADSLTVVSDAMVDVSVQTAPTYSSFQFLRIGFFSVDPDSKPNKLVFNRTVLLKEDSAKK